YLLTCYRYVELNPVRAGLVSHPGDYPWSSYRFNALGETDDLVTPHDLYTGLGRSGPKRRSAYRSLFRSRLGERALCEIREATNKAWVLGDDRFRARVEKLLGRRTSPRARGGDRKSEAFQRKNRINRV
ncbi:MAG: transposase, partial [Gammaproteobacteria bacterium]